jgi:DUF971 family protein
MNLSTQASSVDLEMDMLVVVWADAHASRFSLVELRRKCLCAQCRELRSRGKAIWPQPGAPEQLEVMGAELIGAWGLSVRWNDGHETGVYPWGTLREWCPCGLCAHS